MNIRIEIVPSIKEPELVLRTPQLNEDSKKLQGQLEELFLKEKQLTFYQKGEEFFIPLSQILFIESNDNKVFAHTHQSIYEVKFKLYELEEILPPYFCRISKSTLLNVRQVHSLAKSFSGTSRITFLESYKMVHASRHYYKQLKEKLHEYHV